MQLALRILFIPILISFISLGQTNDDPRKLILQKWKLEEVSIRPAIKQRIKTLRKTDPKKAQQVEDSFETMVKAAQSTVYEYFEDGTYKTKVMLMSEKANWQILADNKTLILKSEKLGEVHKMIVSITSSKMILKDEDLDAPQITYLLADKK